MHTHMIMNGCDSWKRVAVTVGLVAMGSVASFAGPISYTSQYIANALPQTSGGTAANPAWGYGSAGTPSAEVSGGVLTASTMPEGSNQQYWEISNTVGTSAAWNLDSATGVTIDFTIAVQESVNFGGGSPQILGGFNLFISDNNYWASLYFSLDQISIWGSTIAFDNTYDLTSFHTFRAVSQNGLFSLYEGSNATPIFSNIAMNAVGYQDFYWGDGSAGASGAYQLRDLSWNNTLAEFSAPIPEPGTMALVACAGLFLLYLSKRRAVTSQ